MPNKESIPYDRLFETAEVVISVVMQISKATNGRFIYPTDLMGKPEQPECLSDFTKFEVEEATMFLIRLGMIEVCQ